MITMKYVDNLTGRQFELFTGHLLKDLEFHKIKVTKPTGDHGLDVIAKDAMGKSIGIQCKHLGPNEYTGYKALGETFIGHAYYNTDESVLLTNRNITNNAKRSAKKPNIDIKCWDRQYLSSLISIANNLSYKNKHSKKPSVIHKASIHNKHIVQNDFSLTDIKLLGILSSKIIQNNYAQSIILNFTKLIKKLGLNKDTLYKSLSQLISLYDNTGIFTFHSTKISKYTGAIPLFLANFDVKGNKIYFNISNEFIELLKGQRIKGLE